MSTDVWTVLAVADTVHETLLAGVLVAHADELVERAVAGQTVVAAYDDAGAYVAVEDHEPRMSRTTVLPRRFVTTRVAVDAPPPDPQDQLARVVAAAEELEELAGTVPDDDGHALRLLDRVADLAAGLVGDVAADHLGTLLTAAGEVWPGLGLAASVEVLAPHRRQREAASRLGAGRFLDEAGAPLDVPAGPAWPTPWFTPGRVRVGWPAVWSRTVDHPATLTGDLKMAHTRSCLVSRSLLLSR